MRYRPQEHASKGNHKGSDAKGKGKGKVAAANVLAHHVTYSIVPEGWNVLPATEYNGTVDGIFAFENEDDARKLAESAHKSYAQLGLIDS